MTWFIVPLAVVAIAYIVRTRMEAHPRRTNGPVLQCPRLLDFGEREVGEEALIRFNISNMGDAELTIHGVQTTCSCSGLEQFHGAKLVRIDVLRIAPRGRADAAMRVLVQGTPGGTVENLITFHPLQPTAAIKAFVSHVKAGVNTVPTSVVFGTIPIGEQRRQVVDVFDDAVDPRTVLRIESSNAGVIAARLLPSDELTGELVLPDLGRRIAQIEIIADASEPGPLTNDVEIHLASGAARPTRLPISGRVARLVEASPAVIRLPRDSEMGPVYFAECLCRSMGGKTLSLEVESAPMDLTAAVVGTSLDSSEAILRIEWNPSQEQEVAPSPPRTVRLVAQVDGTASVLEIPVYCLRRGR